MRAAIPEATCCSAQLTMPFPPSTNSRPTMIAERHCRGVGVAIAGEPSPDVQDQTGNEKTRAGHQERGDGLDGEADRKIRGAPDDVKRNQSDPNPGFHAHLLKRPIPAVQRSPAPSRATLALRAGTVPILAEHPKLSDHAVARDQDRNRIAGHRVAYGADRERASRRDRQLSIGDHVPSRDPQKRLPDLQLKIGASEQNVQAARRAAVPRKRWRPQGRRRHRHPR